MLNRYSLVFYAIALALTIFDKNIIALIFVIEGFVIGYIHSLSNAKEDDIDRPLSFNEIILFKDKNELLKAVKNQLPEETKEEKKFRINVEQSVIFIAIYLSTLIFLAFIFKNFDYLLLIFATPFLISFEETEE